MEVELWSGGSKAIIDPQGAWLTNLSDEYGDILYPKRTLAASDGSKKVRGGCHVCLPNFGPGGESGQSQHGFGRTALWEVSDKTENSVLLTLEHGEDDYEGLSSLLTYQLVDNKITMTLELTNDGDKELRVAPGFHPYFSTLHDINEVCVDGEERRLDELAEVEFSDGPQRLLETSQRSFTIESQQLTTWALWTDALAPYVCVEPTFKGFAFLQVAPSEDELLFPGKTRSFTTTVAWRTK